MNDPEKTGAYQPETADAPGIDTTPAKQPQQIGRYRVEKILGQGGFGLVYLAHDDQLQRLVAIKVPHRHQVSTPEDAETYLTEARTVANLDHPNIVPVHDVGSTEDCPCFIVSKFIEGSTLAQKIKEDRPTSGEAAEIVATIAEALHYAHRKGLVHRDIKSSNILIDTSGKPFVVDFGLALKEENIGHGPKYAGTPEYMSPEQARSEGHRVDGRSDVFSLGVVFYELLVLRRPFHADSREELLEHISTHEVRPPRQWDDSIPKELERICLKALSKRASERYSTAKDMADDLRHFLTQQPGPTTKSMSTPSVTPVVQPPSTSIASSRSGASSATVTTPNSESRPLKIVPKGLRSFDANDADFFLELLPGPRDREGLPDSIRFWKTRIDEMDGDHTFSVGLIYGSSGCGKSSLVKAGLLPRLAGHVIAVYVESTAKETETRLLNGLRKRCFGLPADLGLKDTLAALRRGQCTPMGKKVVIVLDQFEQWLHAKKEEQNTELVQALRQCDGGRLQCIVMVRDDFWMAATRFMRDLEVRLLEGQNSAAVDLFPIRHAEKVLTAFGRAFGVLPDASTDVNKDKDQKQFLAQALSDLAEEGKVICVRLALFAEMMKGKAWTPATLKEVGGTGGVGVTFLEETFSAATAPPEHRYHEKAARAVLKALLPEFGTDIKGHVRSYGELLELSGYGNRPKDFDDLIHILDSEIRLITPTDLEGKEEDSASSLKAGEKYCQLTHDYLVPSLRDWLTRKQKETRRGRAELLLADRAAVWNGRPENRQLPSLLQWLHLRWLTAKRNWTPPQKKMMARASRYHVVRGTVVGILLAVATFTGLEVRYQIEEKQNATHAAGLVQAVVNADTAQVPEIIGKMAEYRQWADPLLRQENENATAQSKQKLHTSLALLSADAKQVVYLHGRLLDAEPHEVPVIRDTLGPHKDALLDKLWAVVEKPDKGKEKQRLRAAAALAKYDPESEKWTKSSALVVNDLVRENAVFLGQWSEAFKFVKGRLVSPLSDTFRDHQPERAAERTLATNLLADYAADQPQVLADLLMDADEKQFAVLYPKCKEHGQRSLAELLAEIDRKPVIVKDKVIFEKRGMIVEGDAKVTTQSGPLPAKRFEVRLQAGKPYLLTMDSKDFDSFLELQDKTGKELASDNDGGDGLNSLLVYTPSSDDTCTVFAASFEGTGSFVLKVVELAVDGGREKLAKRQANAAVALLKMNHPETVWPLLKHSPDPRARSYLIHRFAPLGVDAWSIVKRLEVEPDLTNRRALVLSLGEFGEKEWTTDERKALLTKLQDIYCTEADPGLHAASEWLLRTWQQEAWLKKTNDDWAKDGEQRDKRLHEIKQTVTKEKAKTPPQWYVNGQGQTMVVIPGPVEFVMGSPAAEIGRLEGRERQHKRRIGRTFSVAAKAVTVEQFLQFDKGYQLPAVYTRTADLPLVGPSWYEAAAYCNWLSKQENIPEEQWCYLPKKGGKYEDGMEMAVNYLQRTGYRLPTEAEMEYATRARALTSRYFGETEELLPKYARYLNNSKEQTWPVGSKKPNDLGFFDMHGNVWCWCQDRYQIYPSEMGEDKEDAREINSKDNRVMRGGSFSSLAVMVRSATRFRLAPTNQDIYVGFRVARTIMP
jgi:eukaryotic-like serine/threonine-protein kinase